MTHDESLTLLTALKLFGARAAYLEQQALRDIHTLPFSDRLGLLLDAEREDRAHRRTTRLLQLAQFRYPRASMKTVRYADRPGLNRSQLLELSLCAWVPKSDVVIICGASGTGKSFLGCALGHAVCKRGYTVRFHRINTLCLELEQRRVDGSIGTFMKRLAKTDLLVLDDLGRTDLTSQERRDLLEIREDRYDRKATVVTSQFAIGNWHSIIGDVSIADAILDRLVHHAHRIELTGESLRKLDPDTRRCEGVTDFDIGDAEDDAAPNATSAVPATR